MCVHCSLAEGTPGLKGSKQLPDQSPHLTYKKQVPVVPHHSAGYSGSAALVALCISALLITMTA
jgi:hypothetical protein